MRSNTGEGFIDDEAQEVAVAARRRKRLRARAGGRGRHVARAVFPIRHADDEERWNGPTIRQKVDVRDGGGELRLVIRVEEDEHRISLADGLVVRRGRDVENPLLSEFRRLQCIANPERRRGGLRACRRR